MSYIRSAISKFLKTQPPARIIALGFALLILCGAALLMLPFAVHPGLHIAPLDALFTATSAVCVTGLVVVDLLPKNLKIAIPTAVGFFLAYLGFKNTCGLVKFRSP